MGLPRLDPTGLFSFGMLGLWLASFSWAARRALGPVLPWLGMLGAGLGGVIVAPIWSVWLGTVLWRMRENTTS